jgi:trk system potassium uptake protein TrkH
MALVRAPRRRRSRLAVDVRGSLALVGRMLKYLSASTLLPLVIAVGYGESVWPFVGAGLIGASLGHGLQRLGDPRRIGIREGYLVVSLMWLLAAGLGALPYLLSGEAQLDRPVDAYFEAMSGFTTTGASVLVDIEALNHSLAMWRQFTQWLGGMGIVVLALAILPRLRVGGRQLLENEMPGPEMDQLADRIRDMAQRLWLLYVGLTAAMIAALMVGHWAGLDERMSLYEAVAHAFTTLPTGGFSTQSRSIEGFGTWSQWVIIVFMAAAGANFALWYQGLVRGRWGAARRDEELRLYVVILAMVAAVVAVELWTEDLVATGEDALRHGLFQAVSLVTGTGYASQDFAAWTQLALMTLVIGMFVGGCAGSTSGSMKVVRHLLLGKVLRRELRQTVHPEEIIPIRLNGRVVDERTLRAIIAFIMLYVGAFVIGAGLIAVEAAYRGPSLSGFEAIAAAAATLGNVGPSLGLSGPMGSYEPYGDLTTVVMTLLMWIGRLEVIPIIVLLTRRYWRV